MKFEKKKIICFYLGGDEIVFEREKNKRFFIYLAQGRASFHICYLLLLHIC